MDLLPATRRVCHLPRMIGIMTTDRMKSTVPHDFREVRIDIFLQRYSTICYHLKWIRLSHFLNNLHQGWWYNDCGLVNLNGINSNSQSNTNAYVPSPFEGIVWYPFSAAKSGRGASIDVDGGSWATFKATEMKISATIESSKSYSYECWTRAMTLLNKKILRITIKISYFLNGLFSCWYHRNSGYYSNTCNSRSRCKWRCCRIIHVRISYVSGLCS